MIQLREIVPYKGDFMGSKKSRVLNLWEKNYKENVQNRFLTEFEAVNMIANELNLDKKTAKTILQDSKQESKKAC